MRGVEQPVDAAPVRRSQQRRIVRTPVRVVEERAFQVGAEDQRVGAGRIRDDGELPFQVGQRRGDQRQHRARGPVAAVQRERGADAVGIRIERRAAAAVPVDVDETGGEPAAGGVDDRVGGRAGRTVVALAHGGDTVAVEEHPAVVDDPPGGDEPGGVDEGAC